MNPLNWVNLRHWLSLKRWRILKLVVLSGLGIFIGGWLLTNTLRLQAAASKPVDAYFVLGGSIRREIYVTQLAKQHPQTRILISKGSEDPCIWLNFQRENAPKEQVYLEKCADSTFGNFYFGVPILRQWGVHKVRLITSPTHLPRAKWLAQILLGAHGIWVEPEIVQEQGIPGNRESWLKTGLDVTRSLFWAVLSQVIQPQCSDETKLVDVDVQAWRNSGFKCEHQEGVR